MSTEDPMGTLHRMAEAYSPDEVLAHERTAVLEVQISTIIGMRMAAIGNTYNVLQALARERPMHDLLFACFLAIETIFRDTKQTPLDRELHYKILAECAQNMLRPPPPATPTEPVA